MSTDNSRKKQARRLQPATGMPYTRALRQVATDHSGMAAAPSATTLLNLLGIENTLGAHRTFPATSKRAPTNDIRLRHRGELLPIPLGLAPDGTPVWLDLRDTEAGGNGPHGVLIGTAGSGKSTALHSLAFALCALHSPQTIQLACTFVPAPATATTAPVWSRPRQHHIKPKPWFSATGDVD